MTGAAISENSTCQGGCSVRWPFICSMPSLPGHAHQCLSLPTLSLQLTHPSLEVTVLNQLILPSLCGTRNYTGVRYTKYFASPLQCTRCFMILVDRSKWEATDSGQCCKMGKAQCSFSLLPRCQVWGKLERRQEDHQSLVMQKNLGSPTPRGSLSGPLSASQIYYNHQGKHKSLTEQNHKAGANPQEAVWLVSPVSERIHFQKKGKAEHLNS